MATDSDKQASSDYQEQPNAHQELEQAISSVPLKDYSDYEITIEAKEHYADALFSDDDALNQALSQASNSNKTEPATEKSSAPPESTESHSKNNPESNNALPVEAVIDYSVFLPPNNYDNAHDNAAHIAAPSSQQAPVLSVTAAGLNHSPITWSADDSTEEQDNKAIEQLLIDTDKPLATTTETDITQANSPKGQSLAEKIKQKAKTHLHKTKADFDEYTGRSLPERELPLEFSFPPLKPKKSFDAIVSGYDIRKLFSIQGKSHHSLFKQADSDLAKLTKCQLSNANRQSLLDAYAIPLFAKTNDVIAMFERKPSVPGNEKRLQLAELVLNTLKHLITGYKQIYSALYEANNLLYGPQRNNANHIVFRLIDLLVLEQQLSTALQSPLPSNSIKTFNKLFYALSLYEVQLITQAHDSLSLGERSSIKAMYLRYQVGLAFDFMRISSSLHKALNPYISQHLKLLHLLPVKDSSLSLKQKTGLITEAWVIAHTSNNAPHYVSAKDDFCSKQQVDEKFPPVIIEVKHFFNAIKKDYAECVTLLGGTKKHSSKILGAIKTPYAATIMSELNRSITLIEAKSQPPRYSLFQPFPCKAYSGLDECMNYFDYQHALSTKKPAKKGEPVKDLPPKPIPEKSSWLCAMQNEDALYLQVDERKTSVPIDIGQLLLFITTLDKEDETNERQQPEPKLEPKQEQQALLTRVVRMERAQQGKLNLIAETISTQSTLARITATTTSEPKSTADSTRVLLSNKGDERLLISDHKQSYSSYSLFNLTLPDSSQAVITIKHLAAVTQKLQILSL